METSWTDAVKAINTSFKEHMGAHLGRVVVDGDVLKTLKPVEVKGIFKEIRNTPTEDRMCEFGEVQLYGKFYQWSLMYYKVGDEDDENIATHPGDNRKRVMTIEEVEGDEYSFYD